MVKSLIDPTHRFFGQGKGWQTKKKKTLPAKWAYNVYRPLYSVY